MKKLYSILIIILICLAFTSCSDFATGLALGKPVYDDINIGNTKLIVSKGYDTAPQKNEDGCYVFSDDTETFIRELYYVEAHPSEFDGQKVIISGLSEGQAVDNYYYIYREYDGYYYFFEYEYSDEYITAEKCQAEISGTFNLYFDRSNDSYFIIDADKVTLTEKSDETEYFDPNRT